MLSERARPHGPADSDSRACFEASISLIRTLRSRNGHRARMAARQLARQVNRPEPHAHQPAHDDAARRPPMPDLRRTRRAHRGIQPMIGALSVLRLRPQNRHRLAFAIRGGAKIFDELIGQRAAHAKNVIDGQGVHALGYAMGPAAVVGQNLQAAVDRRHRLDREPSTRDARQLQVLGGARGRRLQIERLSRRAVKQQHMQLFARGLADAYRATIERDAIARLPFRTQGWDLAVDQQAPLADPALDFASRADAGRCEHFLHAIGAS